MKKSIAVILFVLACFGCTQNTNVEGNYNEVIDDSYLETIPENAKPFLSLLQDGSILLTEEEIQHYNKSIEEKTSSMYDLDIEELTKEQVLAYIESYTIPSLPKYNAENVITVDDIQLVLDNRNLEAIPKDISLSKAIVIHRTNLRAFPTNMHFTDTKNDTNFDLIQESELRVNTPCLVIHKSKDKKWVFVMTKAYVGWILSDAIAYASEKEYTYFTNPDSFAIITDSFVEIDSTLLDMSVHLPYEKVTKEGYELIMPSKDENGNLMRKTVVISKEQAHIGYLPYTKRNVIIQAFKYENIPYRWGGMDNGVDCSSFVGNVYRTFGFEFPRNTSEQRKSVGTIISLTNKTNEEKLSILQENSPSLLFKSGHVLIYLGKIENTHYVINATGKRFLLKVTTEELNSSNYLTTIDRQVLVE